MKEKNKLERRLELSSKFLKMGQSLIEEGRKINDYSITQSGSIMILLAGLMFDEDDMFLFSGLCSMFSSKKILEDVDEETLSNLNMNSDDTYNDFIKKINDLKKRDKDNDSLN
jgi:hypothetical protein